MKAHEILDAHFKRKKKVRGYSLRALARDLGVSAPFMSNVLSGKKPIPLKKLDSLVRLLDIDPQTHQEIRSQLLVTERPLAPGPISEWQPSEIKHLSILRQWYFLALLEMTSCEGFKNDPLDIGSKLGISPKSVEVALRELVFTGLLKEENGSLSKTTRYLRLGSSQSLDDIRRFHRQMLEKAGETLCKTDAADFERRLITGITITAPREKIAVAKKMLSDTLHQIANFLTEEKGNEVYHLSGQLFPLTQRKE